MTSPQSSTSTRYRVEIRLSPEERSQLETLSEQAGMSMSRYIRSACFGKTLPVVVTDVAISTYAELHKLSITLAQQSSQTDFETQQWINELLKLLHQIRAEISGIRSTESGLHHEIQHNRDSPHTKDR
ncbi:hypothetical protein H6F89_20225 [Cyanobacteria bacterium FACHB-63]|nr:hypothetical protein [Cyanobacteria bacterium FACHB-63]